MITINKIKIPIWEKLLLTLEEASIYSNIGINRIRSIADEPTCPFVLFVGNKKLIKRKEFEQFLSQKTSV